ADGLFPGLARLIREADDEIHADVVDSGGAEDFGGGGDAGASVHAAGGLEFAVVKGLDAQADAIETCGEPGGGFFGCDGFGICLEGDLGTRKRGPSLALLAEDDDPRRIVGFEDDLGRDEFVARAESVEGLRKGIRGEKAGSATSEVD